MVRHPNRAERIHLLTVDPVLAADVADRLAFDPRTRDWPLVRPEARSIKEGVAELQALARETTRSRLLIFDVRSHTLHRLHEPYNKVVGYNREDFNELCFVMLIGDGPLNLFHASKSLQVFLPHLVSHRIDYSPAVYFYDPFLHYTPDERRLAGIARGGELPTAVPQRLQRAFKGAGGATVDQVRKYFRAAGLAGDARRRTLRRRQEKLARFYRKRIAEEFPHHAEQLGAWLGREGYALSDETLRLHLYPLHFEDWAAELMARAGRP